MFVRSFLTRLHRVNRSLVVDVMSNALEIKSVANEVVLESV